MIWLSRLESTANKHRLAAGKAARTVKANVVLDEVIRVHNREALAQDAPDLLSQAVTQLLLKDWRAQPKRKVSWQRYWRGMSLPSTFVYEGAIVPTKTISEVARHPPVSATYYRTTDPANQGTLTTAEYISFSPNRGRQVTIPVLAWAS